jgi:3-hydroxyacyl-[acyl-carrier-protein] dehydratase
VKVRFLFVDRIDHLVRNRRARGSKTISFEEGFLSAPYPKPGEFPRLLILESVAQLASWLVMFSTDFRQFPVLARLEKAEIVESVVAGDRLTLDVEIASLDADGALFQAEISRDGRPIGRGRNCLCAFTPLERLTDPETMRAAFKELTRHAVLE